MRKKILTIFTIFLIATSGINFVSAQNETDDILITETVEEESDENRIRIQRENDSNQNNEINTINQSEPMNSSNRIGEEVKSLENGYANVLFDDGYRGYCVNHDLLSTSSGEKFIVENTDTIIGSKYGEPVGNYLKILFVDHYNYTMNPTTDLSQVIWTFTDNYYKNSNNEIIKSILESASNGRIIPDHGAVTKVNSTTEAIFDFECLNSIYYRTQNFFGYKINYRTLEQNNTQIEDEILGTSPENNTLPENTTTENTTTENTTTENTTTENTTTENTTTENTTTENTTEAPKNNTIPKSPIDKNKTNATHSIAEINDDSIPMNQNEYVNLAEYKTGLEFPILLGLLLILMCVLIIRCRD